MCSTAGMVPDPTDGHSRVAGATKPGFQFFLEIANPKQQPYIQQNFFNMIKLINFLTFFSAFAFTTQAQQGPCALKLGGNFYINCQHTIVYQGQDIMTVTELADRGSKVNFDIFSPAGVLEAKVRAGKLTEGAANFAIVSSADTFSLVDKRDGRKVCHVEKKFNLHQERCDLLVWADLYLPDGNRFQCTPETTNVPFLNFMQGGTFQNMHTAIKLN